MDITTRKSIELLITRFYEKVRQDNIIGFIFNDVMKVNWEEHLPVMFDFWETILLNETKYMRNAMGIHFEVNRKVKLEKKHFVRWVQLFTETTDELYTGEVAEMAKKRARSIADVMLFKMNQENEGLIIPKKE
ncbi:MAG: group III truncated hemoglobin [Chitinophagaceae bacterium]|nr:group III truncated hemoglobin [Chitinophagaceae bacterium]